ncbi:MAG: ribosome silencing factor [Bacteroidia bacterium]
MGNTKTGKKDTTEKVTKVKTVTSTSKTKAKAKKTDAKNTSKTSKSNTKNKVIKDAALELVKAIVLGMEEKKGKNIVYLDLRKIPNSVCEFFVICDAESTTQVNALAYSVEETVKKKTGESPWHMEGLSNNQWVLIDYVNVVAHVFQTPSREFYNIEKLWADAEFTYVSE